MGNHRFKLSDMMPNAWFYKLRDMSKLKNHNPVAKKPPFSTQNTRKLSFYYSNDQSIRMDNKLCVSPPRKSSKKRAKRKTIYMPSPRKINPSDEIFQGYFHSPDQEFLEYSPLSEDSFDAPDNSTTSCSCKLSSSATDIIINLDETSVYVDKRLTEFSMVSESESELQLPRIITNPGLQKSPKSAKSKQKRSTKNTSRKSVSRSGGVKIRKLASKKNGTRKSSTNDEKKGLFCSESFAIVKASFDPERDFRDSMMEMIVENNIRESKDLEELLACFLSLNSNQYHEIIIKAFEQIWFKMPGT